MTQLSMEFDPSNLTDAEFLENLSQLLSMPKDARAEFLDRFEDLTEFGEDAAGRSEQLLEGLRARGITSPVLGSSILSFHELLVSRSEVAIDPALDAAWISEVRKAIEDGGAGELDGSFGLVAHSVCTFARSAAGEQLVRTLRRKATAVGLLPSYVGVQTTVDLRPVIVAGSAVDLVPVVSLCIAVNRGTPTEFAFQLDEDELTEFRDALERASELIGSVQHQVKVRNSRSDT